MRKVNHLAKHGADGITDVRGWIPIEVEASRRLTVSGERPFRLWSDRQKGLQVLNLTF